MIIDTHTHAFGDVIAAKTMDKLRQIIKREPEFDGTVSGLRGAMERNGVSRSIVLAIATKPSQHNTINAWAAENNNGNITAFGSVHPDCEDVFAELTRIKSLGLKGIKIHPDYQGMEIDDPRYYKIYEGAEQLGLIAEFHCGYDSKSPNHAHNSPDRMAKILTDFPRLTVVGGHLGGNKMWDEVEEHLGGKNIYLESSLCADSLDPKQMRRICDKHNPDLLMFGSDAPWRDVKAAINYIRELKLPGDREEKLFSGNAKRLLGI